MQVVNTPVACKVIKLNKPTEEVSIFKKEILELSPGLFKYLVVDELMWKQQGRQTEGPLNYRKEPGVMPCKPSGEKYKSVSKKRDFDRV